MASGVKRTPPKKSAPKKAEPKKATPAPAAPVSATSIPAAPVIPAQAKARGKAPKPPHAALDVTNSQILEVIDVP